MDLLEVIPSAYLALLFVSGFSLVSVGCLWLVQKWLHKLHFHESLEMGEIFSDAIGVLFALLFALVTVAVWQNHDRLDTTVSYEANGLHNLYRDLEQYPPELRLPCQAMLRAYVQQVITVEWPLLKEGKQDPVAHQFITDINKKLLAYRPASLGELPLHGETLKVIFGAGLLHAGDLQQHLQRARRHQHQGLPGTPGYLLDGPVSQASGRFRGRAARPAVRPRARSRRRPMNCREMPWAFW